jgi:hypothetical protein
MAIAVAILLRAVTVGKTWFGGSGFRRFMPPWRRFATPASIWPPCIGALWVARMAPPSGRAARRQKPLKNIRKSASPLRESYHVALPPTRTWQPDYAHRRKPATIQRMTPPAPHPIIHSSASGMRMNPHTPPNLQSPAPIIAPNVLGTLMMSRTNASGGHHHSRF